MAHILIKMESSLTLQISTNRTSNSPQTINHSLNLSLKMMKHTMIKRMHIISTMMSNNRSSISHIKMMDTTTTTTMESWCLIRMKVELTIDRQPPQSTGKVTPSILVSMRKNQLRRHTKNMKLQQRPFTNQINSLSLGAILETQTEEQVVMELLLTTSQKGKISSKFHIWHFSIHLTEFTIM